MNAFKIYWIKLTLQKLPNWSRCSNGAIYKSTAYNDIWEIEADRKGTLFNNYSSLLGANMSKL